MADEIEKVDLASKDLVAERVEEIKELFPEVFSEGGIDFEKLRLVLGDEVDDEDERYAFTWPGKRDAIRQSQTPSTATLRPCPDQSVNWDRTQNLYIEGDNLEVLKLLQRAYCGKVKMIYIDPPYNTGHDFVYKDSFEDSVENYREQTRQADQSNPESAGRYHANWCSMMYPRLRLARELLEEDGVIFISIDDNEVDNLKKLMDEIFSPSCFAARFMWTKTMTPPSLSYKCRKTVEYVLCYEKKANNSKFFGDWLDNGDAPLLNGGNPIKDLVFPPHSVYFAFLDQGTLPAGSYEGVSLPDKVDIVNGWNTCSITMRGQFKWGQEMLDNELASGTYCIAKTRKLSIRFQRAQSDERYKTPTNFLPIKLDSSIGVGTNESASTELENLEMGGLFDFTKPTSLIEALIKMKCFIEKDDIICDFFSGSSTTACAVMALNAQDGGKRRMISVQLPENLDSSMSTSDAKTRQRIASACSFLDGLERPHVLTEIGKERIRRAGKQIADEVEGANRQLRLGEEPKQLPDIGFRVLKLDESGIATARPGELLLNRVKEDRSEEDIIFEMMLKWGLELTYPVEKTEIAGYPCYTVAGDALICCMEPGLTTDVIEAIAELAPDRVFVLDSALDDTVKLNMLQTFKRVEEHTQHKIDLRTV